MELVKVPSLTDRVTEKFNILKVEVPVTQKEINEFLLYKIAFLTTIVEEQGSLIKQLTNTLDKIVENT